MDAEGRLQLSYMVMPRGNFRTLPRLGIQLGIDSGCSQVQWWGNFYETYPDRREAQWQGLNTSTPDEVCGELHVVPQESGNRSAYWTSLAVGDKRMSFCSAEGRPIGFSLRRYDDSTMTAARRTKDLTTSDRYIVNIDSRQAGLGTATCGPGVRERYRISGDSVQRFRLVMVPSMLDDSVNLWRYCGYYFDNPPELRQKMPDRYLNHVKSISIQCYGDSTEAKDRPNAQYASGFPEALYDGRLGIAGNYSESWMGFQGRDSLIITIELDEPVTLQQTAIGFCHSGNDWVVQPQLVEVQWSRNGKRFSPWQEMTPVRPIANEQKESRRLLMWRNYQGRQGLFHPAEARNARYLRIRIACQATLPDWHDYSGEPAWLMIDEITVK